MSLSADDILQESVCKLLEDTVCIDSALKNLIAKVFGSFSGNEYGASFTENTNPQEVYNQIMSSVRIILQCFNKHTLESYEEWAISHSQRDDESSDERLNELISYKAALFVRNKVEGKKFSKVLGRRYLKATKLWESVLFQCQETVASSNIERGVFQYICSEFGLSLEDSYQDKDLIWTNDFQEALQKKQEKRRQEAL